MSLDNDETLREIMRPVTQMKLEPPDGSTVVVAYNSSSRRAQRPRMLAQLRGNLLYAVRANYPVSHRVKRRKVEEIGPDGKPLEAGIVVTLLLEALPGREFTVVEQAHEHRATSLGMRVDDFVHDIIRAEIAHRQAMRQPILGDFRRFREELGSRIQQRVGELGLRATRVDIEIPPAQKIPREIEINRGVTTYCRDYPSGLINLRVDIGAIPDPVADLEHAIYFTGDTQFRSELIDVVQNTYKQEIDIDKGYTEPTVVSTLVQDKVRAWLKSRGWTLTAFAVVPEFDFDIPAQAVPDPFYVYCTVNDRADQVAVEHTLLLERKDLRKALMAPTGDAIKEIKGFAQNATQRRLFEASYVDVLLAFDQGTEGRNNSLVMQVQTEVAAFAETRGYAVLHLAAIPSEQANMLQRDGVKFSIPAERQNDPNGEAFELHDARIKGSLLVDIDARLPRLSEIKNVLAQETDLIEAMRRSVVAELSSLLLKTSPHRFHTEFSTTPDGTTQPLQQELRDAVRRVLNEKFHLDSVEPIIRMGENDLTRRLKSLARGLHVTPPTSFTVEDEHGAGEQFRMSARYTVNGIFGDDPNAYFLYEARSFQSAEDEVDAVNIIIDTELRRLFKGMSARVLRSINFRTPLYQAKMGELLRQKVAGELGLAISIGAIVPEEAGHEENLRSLGDTAWRSRKAQFEKVLQSDEATIDELIVQKRKLLEMKTNIIEAGEFEDTRLPAIEAQIDEIDSRIAPADTEIAKLKSPTKLQPRDVLAITDALDRALEGIVDRDAPDDTAIGHTP